MSEPLRYPDPDEAAARLEAWHRAKDAESEPLRAEHAAQMARRAPEEAQDGAREAVRVFGRLPGGGDGKGPRW